MVSTDAARRTAAMGGKEELAVAQGLADAASGVTDVARQFAGANVALKNAEAAIRNALTGTTACESCGSTASLRVNYSRP